jgi:hypothetical protein
MVGLTGRKTHLVEGIYMPTSQRSFSMPVYYRLEKDDHQVSMTKLSITQIDRHSYGWTVQDADEDVLAKAVYRKEELVSEEPFCLPQQMQVPCWKLLSTTGSFKMKQRAHFEVCPSPFATMQQLEEATAKATSKTTAPATSAIISSLCIGERARLPDSDDDTGSDEDMKPLSAPMIDAEEDDDFVPCDEDRRSVFISEKWSARLEELPATQGTMSSEVDAEGEVVLKVRPAWPDWLKDVSFDVIKTNRFGNRQRRQTQRRVDPVGDGRYVRVRVDRRADTVGAFERKGCGGCRG